MKQPLPRFLLPIVASCALAACVFVSSFDPVAYERATSAKAEALLLMDKATDDYRSHKKDIEAVTLDINKAFEYDRGLALNESKVQLWETLLSPDRDLFGGFLRDWKRKRRLTPFFVEEKKKQVGQGFDEIIQLESGKPKRPQGMQ